MLIIRVNADCQKAALSSAPVSPLQVIELDSSNEKALYRRGEARLLKNEFSLALRDFGRVLEVNPKNRAARTQISVCKRKIREHHEMDKRTYANMFQKFAERDAKVSTHTPGEIKHAVQGTCSAFTMKGNASLFFESRESHVTLLSIPRCN